MKRLFPLYLVIFVGFIAYSIQIPIFTSFLLENTSLNTSPLFSSFDKNRLVLGLLLSMYPLGQFFGAPILGAFSDRFGRKKILVTSLLFTILATTFVALCIYFVSILLLHLALFLAGMFEGNIAIAQGAIVDSVEDTKRGRYFGYIYVASSFGFIAGPLLASLFSNSELSTWFSPATSFWVVIFLLLLTTVWVYAHFKETHNGIEKLHRGFFQEFTNLSNTLKDKNLRYYYGVNFILYFSIFGFLRIYPTYLVLTYQLDFSYLSIMIAYVSLPFVIVNLFLTPLFSKLQEAKKITIITSLLMGLFMISITLFPSFSSLWFTLGATTFFLAFVMTFSAAMISFMADKEHQGAVMGNNQSLVASAQGISATIGGAIAMIAAFLPLLFFGLLAIIAGILLLRRHHAEWQMDHHHESKPVVIEDKDNPFKFTAL